VVDDGYNPLYRRSLAITVASPFSGSAFILPERVLAGGFFSCTLTSRNLGPATRTVSVTLSLPPGVTASKAPPETILRPGQAILRVTIPFPEGAISLPLRLQVLPEAVTGTLAQPFPLTMTLSEVTCPAVHDVFQATLWVAPVRQRIHLPVVLRQYFSESRSQ